VDNGGTGGLSRFCILFGTTSPFTPSHLAALYPNHGRFVSQWSRAANRAVKAGYLLPADAEELTNSAAMSDIGR